VLVFTNPQWGISTWAIWRNGAQALGLAVASLIQINDPECVLFADVEGFGKAFFTRRHDK